MASSFGMSGPFSANEHSGCLVSLLKLSDLDEQHDMIESKRRSLLLGNMQLSRRFDPSDMFFVLPGFSPLGSDKSTRSMSTDSGSKKSVRFTGSYKEKKYSINHLSIDEAHTLEKEYSSIVNRVEKPALLNRFRLNKELGKLPAIEDFIDAGTFEGEVIRKQICKAGKKPALSREWRTLYAVLQGNELSFYKDVHFRRHNWHFHDEPPLKINSNTLITETSSKKRRYLIQIRLSDESELLLQCQSVKDWARWLAELKITVKRCLLQTTLTTSYGPSLASTPLKSANSSAPSTPALPKTPFILMAIKTPPESPDDASDEHSSDSNMKMVLTGVVAQPYSQMLTISSVVNRGANTAMLAKNDEMDCQNYSVVVEEPLEQADEYF